jgi:endoglucanase
MRRIVRNVIVAAIVIFTSSQGSVVSEHGPLKVQNNKVVDSLGRPIQLAGMSLYWSTFGGTGTSWGANDFFNANVVSTMAKDWKSSLIRAPAGVISGSGQNVYSYPQTMNLVKQVVDAAIANGIYVIVDWHLENSTPSQSDATKFFTEMTQTYKSTPNIIWEIWNEPKNVQWSDIKSYANTMIPLIRQNSQNLILVGTPNWSHNPDQAANDPITIDPNIAYTLHFYAAQNCDASKLDADNNTAMTAANSAIQKAAVFISEWGTVCNSGSGSVEKTWSDKWLAWAKTNGVSWANWSLSNKNETSAAISTSGGGGGGWSDNQLTSSGTYVRGKIQEVAAELAKTSSIDGAMRNHATGMDPRLIRDGRNLSIQTPAGTSAITVMDAAGRIVAKGEGLDGRLGLPPQARGLVFVWTTDGTGSKATPLILSR